MNGPMTRMFKTLGISVIVAAVFVTAFDVPPVIAEPERAATGRLIPPPQRGVRGYSRSAPSRKTFFDIFRPRTTKKSRWKKKRTRRPRGVQSAPRVVELAKEKNALVVAVFGDEYAEALAEGLTRAFYQVPSIRVADKHVDKSGLIDKTATDWPAKLAKDFETGRVDFAVIMLGLHDRAEITEEGEVIAFRGDGWESAYRRRIEALLLSARDGAKPVYWVGLPPTKDPEMSKDFSHLNDLYRESVYAVGGRFIDIWDGFVDAEHQYSRQGPDIAGRTVALRRRDGIHFNKAGRRKLAYFVEREIRRDAGFSRAYAGAPAADNLPPPNLYTGDWRDRPQVGPMLSLTRPRLDLGAPLLGASDVKLTVKADSPPYWLMVRGDALYAPGGRVDDFRWPPPSYGDDPDAKLPDNDLESEIGLTAGVVSAELRMAEDGNDAAAVGTDEFTVPEAYYLEPGLNGDR